MPSDSDSSSLKIRKERDGSIDLEATGSCALEIVEKIDCFFTTSTEQKSLPLFSKGTLVGLPSPFFLPLIREINDAYSWRLYTSTYVCLRKLFENLIIELLRNKFGTSRLELFYKASERKFQSFSKLIKNLGKNEEHFKPYSGGSFDQKLLSFLASFKEDANAQAHSIEIFQDSNEIDRKRKELDHYFAVMCETIERIKSERLRS